MSDFKGDFCPTLRPALAAKQPVSLNAIQLSAVAEGTIIHVLSKSDSPEMETRLRNLQQGVVRTVAPGQWFIVNDTLVPYADMKALFAALEPTATGVDQSHGRIRIRVEGSMAQRMLTQATALDLWPEVFPVGKSATTLIGHIATHLTRVDDSSFELIVLRGFSESLWEDLVRMILMSR